MGGFTGNVHLVLLAGGKGLRAGGDTSVPKQFRPTGQGLLFTVSLASFLQLPVAVGRVASVTITVADSWRDTAAGALAGMPGLGDLQVHLAAAGTTRTQSTWNALTWLKDQDLASADLVAVHDAARPFASAALLARLVDAAPGTGAIPGIPVADTIVQLGAKSQAGYLDRSTLMAVQTPQIFPWDLLYQAHAWAAEQGASFTDDGGLLAARGCDPVVVEGNTANWKITTESDWRRAEDLLKGPPVV